MSRLRIACGFVVLMVVIAASGWAATSAWPLRSDGAAVLPLPRAAEQARQPLPAIEPAPIPDLDRAMRSQNQSAATAQEHERFEETAARLKAAAAEMQAAKERMVLHLAAQAGPPPNTVTYRVAPVYPEAAKGHGVEAVVTLNVTVGTAGEVTNVEVVRTRLTTERDVTDATFWASQPSKLFGQAAEDAVRVWRFEPTGATRSFEVPVSFGEPHQMAFVPIGVGGRGGVNIVNPTTSAVRYGPDAETKRIRVGGGVRQPAMISKVAPVYPAAAKMARVEGVVIIELVIATDGTVGAAWVRRSIPLLDQAALDAVVQWTYEPTLLNGAPVEVIATVTVNFTLSQ